MKKLTILDLENLSQEYGVQSVIENGLIRFSSQEGAGETIEGDPNENNFNDVVNAFGVL